jgi:hypothetical protein
VSNLQSPPETHSDTKKNPQNTNNFVATYVVVFSPNYTTYPINFPKYPQNVHTKEGKTPKTNKIVLDKENASIV